MLVPRHARIVRLVSFVDMNLDLGGNGDTLCWSWKIWIRQENRDTQYLTSLICQNRVTKLFPTFPHLTKGCIYYSNKTPCLCQNKGYFSGPISKRVSFQGEGSSMRIQSERELRARTIYLKDIIFTNSLT